ncbi:MAG: hypothetical protein U9Q71_07150 [Pseudomonadota bacterium]|nr:hypothetical protein [Pseudomonadota bacterium]
MRHLVMPGNVARAETVLRFIAERISHNTYVNIMGRYRPCYRADGHPPRPAALSQRVCTGRCGRGEAGTHAAG